MPGLAPRTASSGLCFETARSKPEGLTLCSARARGPASTGPREVHATSPPEGRRLRGARGRGLYRARPRTASLQHRNAQPTPARRA